MALYRSLEKNAESFTLWILCFDDKTYEVLSALNLTNANFIRQQEFEAGDQALLGAKKNRSRVEYYWTCTPSFLLYIFNCHPDIKTLVYLDADVYFFRSPAGIIGKLGDGSILINLQDNSAEFKLSEASGTYNVGVMAFRAGENAMKCLNWWRERCIECCVYKPEEGKYGDQHYLNDWTERFGGIVVPQSTQFRAAPWNISKYAVALDEHGQFTLNGDPLVCYHFHALFFCTHRLVFLASWATRMPPLVRDYLYAPYVDELLSIEKELTHMDVPSPIPIKGIPWRYLLGRLVKMQPLRNFLWAKSPT